MVHSDPKRKLNQERKSKMRNNETGRSMVEMLGVLAIMGILSIGGIAGYTYAMNRLKANDIIDGVNKRAVALSTYMLLGTGVSATTLDAEFANKIGDFPVALAAADPGFTLTVSEITRPVCNHVLNNGVQMARTITLGTTKVWENGVKADYTCAEDGNTIVFTFAPAAGEGGNTPTCGYCQHDENGTCVADETCDNGCSGDKPILQANGTCGSCPTIVATYFGGANEQECQKCGSYYHAWNGACKSDPENCPEGSFQFRDTCYDCHNPDDLHSITAEELERCASACRGIRIITTAPGWGTSCALPCNGKGQFYDGWGYCRTCGVTQYWGNCTSKCPGLTYAAGNYYDDCQIVSNCPEGQHLDACCASGYVYHETKKSYYGQYSMGVCCPSTRPNWDGSKCTE